MRIAALIPALLLTGCTTDGRMPASLVADPQYQAIGGSPGWDLAIGNDEIALRLGHDHFGGDVAYAIYRIPRVLPREADGVRRWESGSIIIEARSGPCEHGNGLHFEDSVVVRLGDQELAGCGGRILSEGQR
jgi:hypothetical protein